MSTSVFKYVRSAAALRYLKNWSLRITPPDQFNDPFEFRPAVNLSFKDLPNLARSVLRDELIKAFSHIFKNNANEVQALEQESKKAAIAKFLMREMSLQEEETFLGQLGLNNNQEAYETRDKIEATYKEVLAATHAELPLVSKVMATALHGSANKFIGILCLSGSSRHPLMWAHYAENHQGALLEFDASSLCFSRRRHSEDEFGVLRRVYYADTRPVVSNYSNTDFVNSLAFTKALEWAYEQEHRLIWPLEFSDRQVDADGAKIHLIDVPSTALRSITLGCKASEPFANEVSQLLATDSATAHINLRCAKINDDSFSLNYFDIPISS